VSCRRIAVPLITCLLAASSAAAEPVVPAPPDKREVPDYGGHPPPQRVRWLRTVGRVVLFPIYVVNEYVVRRPLGFAVDFAEHARAPRVAIRYLFLGPKVPGPAIYPVALYDFGFQPSVGLRVSWNDGFLTPGSKLGLKLGYGGSDWLRADGALRVGMPFGTWVGFDAAARHRPDAVFYGIGGRTPEDAKARYELTRTAVGVSAGWRWVSVVGGTSGALTTTSDFHGGPSIEEQVAAGNIAALPAGYSEEVIAHRLGVTVALDSRSRKREESGARFDGIVERVWQRDRTRQAWTHVDATAGAGLLFDPVGERKLDLRLRVEMVEARSAMDVPFLELATIGGSRDLRGFSGARARDASALAFTLDYQWPLAAWLDATAYLGVGNVFGPRLGGFHTGKLRGSAGFGLSLAGFSDERQVELWAAGGTDPFDQGFSFTSFRLVLGYSRDY
jgi:hypothetical protein